MAVTRLSDAVIPAVYGAYTAYNSPEKTDFFQSGVVIRNAMLDAKANTGGQEIQLPFWRDLDSSIDPNASNDDPADMASPNKISSGMQRARIAYLNQGYSSADLVAELSGSSPMQQIRNRFGTYWQKQWEKRVIAAALGVMADNVANDAGDMVFNASAAAFSGDSFIKAAMTLGDGYESLTAVAMHSLVYQQLLINKEVKFGPDAAGGMTVPTYLGKRVVVDDSLPTTPVVGPPAGIESTVILFGQGAFGYGEGTPEVPVEVERQARAGNGGGVETLWERKTWLLHPFGFQFTGASISKRANTNGRVGATTTADEFSPLVADLAKAANWDRVVERKSVPLAFLKVKAA